MPKVVNSSWLMVNGLLVALLVTCYLSLVTFSFAAENELQAPAGSLDIGTQVESLPQYVVNVLFLVAAFLAVLYLMYGGIKWITSRGDKVAVESARKHIVAAVIGLVIVAGSFFAMNVVFTILGADNPLKEGFKLPTIKEVQESR